MFARSESVLRVKINLGKELAMLRSIKDITGYPVEAIDGKIGEVGDCLFDDDQWMLRYISVDTGKWLLGKQVLISSLHFERPEVGSEDNHFRVNLGVNRIKNAPTVDTTKSVSRKYEEEFARYYGQNVYWDGAAALGASVGPAVVPPGQNENSESESLERARHKEQIENIRESHLRSSNEVIGYEINCSDDEFGGLDDLILDDITWQIRFLVVDTRNWLPGRKFLIDVNWLESFDWIDQKANVGLKRSEIEGSPEYDPQRLVNKDYLDNLYDFYGRPPEEKGFFSKIFQS